MDNGFYSMDKLVEFGVSFAIANQMVSSMNQTIRQMDVPGAGRPMPAQTEQVYYVVLDGQQSGPYSLSELSRLIMQKKVVKETYIWKPGMAQWDLAENIEDVLRLVMLTPPPIPDPSR